MSYSPVYVIQLNTTDTGLASDLRGQIYASDGTTTVGSAISTGFVEFGGGWYGFGPTIPDNQRGYLKIYRFTGGTILSWGAINPEELENNDAKVTTRMATFSYTAPDNSSITAIKAKTDNLPSDPADASDIAGSFSTVNSSLITIAGYIDTEVASIKAKTDNLPAVPASQGDVTTVGAAVATVATYVDTEVAAIKAKTDNLPSDPADASDIAALFATNATTLSTISATLTTIAGYVDTEVAAIKAKTDNLPGDPSSAATIATSFSAVSASLVTIASYIDTEVAAIKAKTDNIPAIPASQGDVTTVETAVGALAIPTTAAINTALTTAHGSGSWQQGAGSSLTDNSIAAAVWDRLMSAILTPASIGKVLKDYLTATPVYATPGGLPAYVDSGTIIGMDRYKLALGRLPDNGDVFDNVTLQGLLQTSSRDVENATRRYWVPSVQTLAYDVPPSSRLNLLRGRMAEEMLVLNDENAITVTAYDTLLTEGTDYKLIYNKENTAINAIERVSGSVPIAWDTDHRSESYRARIIVTGVRAAAPYIPSDIAMATEMWAVIRYHMAQNDYLSGAAGPSELNFTMPDEVGEIADLLARHTRFENVQIRRVGTD